jgi:hypothetical protein
MISFQNYQYIPLPGPNLETGEKVNFKTFYLTQFHPAQYLF